MIGWSLLAPLGLAALAALAIPLLLHLIRRAQNAPIDFPALRWLDERAKPRRRLKFDDPWLLLLRLALLAVIALLLARPLLHEDTSGAAARWVVLIPPVSQAQAQRALAADASAVDARWHWLLPGFPPIGDATQAVPERIAASSLLRELDARLPAAVGLTVIAPRELEGLDGARVQLRRALDWRVVDGRMPSAQPSASASLQIALHTGSENSAAEQIVRAAVTALNSTQDTRYQLTRVQSGAAIPVEAQWLFWLDAGWPAEAQAWVEAGGVAFVSNQTDDPTGSADDSRPLLFDALGTPLLRERSAGQGRVLSIATSLDAAHFPLLLDAEFPRHLHDWMADEPLHPSRALAASIAIEPAHDAAEAVSHASVRAASLPAPGSRERSFDSILMIVIASLFLLERLQAGRRRRST